MVFAAIFLVFSSGSMYLSSYWNRRYEETLPLTLCLATLILYVFGWFNQLTLGVYVVLGLAFSLYVYSLYGIFKNRSAKQFVRNFFTPAFFIFFTLTLVAYLCNYGRLAYSWDEFSHWADVVKAMREVNGLSTHPDAHSAFASYPPAMALLQFMGVIVSDILPPSTIFSQSNNSEWPLYFIYLTASFSLFMPFLNSMSFRKPLSILISGILVFLLPGLFNSSFYTAIYIDSYLGLFSGFLLSYIFCKDFNRNLERVTLILSFFILILVKDAAMLFAAMGIVALFVKLLQQTIRSPKAIRFSLGLILLCVLSIFISKTSWNLSIHFNQAYISFSTPYDLRETIDAFLGVSQNYKSEVIINFIKHVLNGIQFPALHSTVSYCILFSALLLITLFGCNHRENNYIFFILSLLTVVYTFGLLITYMNKFSEYEAVRLASVDRYLSILLTALAFIGFVLSMNTSKDFRSMIIKLFCLIFILLIAPRSQIQLFLNRTTVDLSLSERSLYKQIVDYAHTVLADTKNRDDIKINVISQEDNGFDHWVLRYSLRPYQVSGNWSIGQPFYDGDIWTSQKTLDEWKMEVEEYSHILLWQVNPYFIETYGELFEGDIYPKSLYSRTPEGTYKNMFFLEPEKTEIASYSFEKSSSNEFLRYVDIAEIFDQYGTGTYEFEIELKTALPASTLIYMQNGSTAKYGFSENVKSNTEYDTISFITDVQINNISETESWLAFYSGYGTGAIPTVRSVRIFKHDYVIAEQ